MNKNITTYKKVGRKYVPTDYYDVNGLPEGLYLLYRSDKDKEKKHNVMLNALHYAKVHEIQDISRFCDFYVNYEELIRESVSNAFERFEDKPYSISDIALEVIKNLSLIK